jgi:WD40 repeat protein
LFNVDFVGALGTDKSCGATQMNRFSVKTLLIRLLTVTLAASALTSGDALCAQSKSASGASNERLVFRSSEVDRIEAIAVSDDAEFVATLSLKHVELFTNRASINVYHATTGQSRFSAEIGDVLRPDCTDESWLLGALSRISFSPNGKFVAAGAIGCSVVKCWDLATGKECLSFLFKAAVARQWFRSLSFSEDSHALALDLPLEVWNVGPNVWEEELVIFDTKSWAAPSRVRVPADGAYGTPAGTCSTSLQADRSRFYIANHESRKLAVWDVRADQPRLVERRSLSGVAEQTGSKPAGECALSRDGSLIFFSGSIIRSHEGKQTTMALEAGDASWYDLVEFSPDGTHLAGIRSRAKERLGGIPSAAVLDRLARAPDKTAGSAIGDVVVWSTKTGKRVAERTRAEWWPTSVAIFPDNNNVLMSDGTKVVVWRLSRE